MSPPIPSEFEPLTPAERLLVENLSIGGFDRLAGGGLPGDDAPERTVRATLLRYLLIGGPDAPRIHEKGIRLAGARIAGTLDLEGCRIPRDIGLADCLFEGPLVLRSAVVGTLFLDGSILPGLLAERLEARGDLNLRGARVDGPLLLPGARIGGSLVADGGAFDRPQDVAIDGRGLEARGSVMLRGATVRGGVDLVNARLGGDLEAIGARLERAGECALDAEGLAVAGSVMLRRAGIEGEAILDAVDAGGDLILSGARLDAPGGTALRLGRGKIAGALVLDDGAQVTGLLDLNGSTIGLMTDDPACWPGQGDLAVNRCLYGAFLAAPVDAATRLAWLGLQEPGRWGEDFWPQPYEQLAAVLFETGHHEDAQRVLFEKERLQRRARRARARAAPVRLALWLRDAALALTVGYGRRGYLVFVWLAVFWAVGAGLLSHVEERDAIRPNVPVVLRSPEWILCAVPQGEAVALPSLAVKREGLAAPGQSQVDCWSASPEADAFPPFNAWMFAVDTLLPALDTGQRSYWSPDSRTPLGAIAKGFTYVLTIAGWGLSLLAVAAFSGLVRSR